METLPHGCKCSDLKVHPSTWKRVNASVKEDWYIYYRFYDPLFKEKYPKGKLKILKGMNDFKNLHARQAFTQELLNDHLAWLKDGWNPITKQVNAPPREEAIDYIIHPDTPFITALEAAKERLSLDLKEGANMRSVMRYVSQAIKQLRLDEKPIKDVQKRHVIMILEQCEKNKPRWSNYTFNWYRRSLRDLFDVLEDVEAVNSNIMLKIDKKEHEPAKKVLLTQDERKAIDEHLRATNYTFWRFMHIFFHSGARTTELMKVKYEDVNLERQLVAYTILKGKKRIEHRPISDNALHLWRQVLAEGVPGQYLFSHGLKPGSITMQPDRPIKLWRKWVQNNEKLHIKATWYALKHLNSDELAAAHGIELPAFLNKHDPAITRKHYAVNYDAAETEKMNEIIKKAQNTFS